MTRCMMRNFLWIGFLLLVVSSVGFAQEATQEKPSAAKASKKAERAGVPDKALMQKIWDGWGTLDPANVAKFYAKGPEHVFFDIAPLKYNSWEEYQEGVKKVLANFQSIQATVNGDARLHHNGKLVWGTATVHHEDAMKDGTKSQGDFRWTVIWEKTGKDWLIVHEHISEPLAALEKASEGK